MSATEQLAVSPALAPSPTPVAPRIVPAADALRWAAMGGIFAAFLAAWQWLPAILAIPPYILPPLSDTMAEMARMWAQEDLLANFLSTLSMTILGFLVGGFCGAAGGYLLGMSRFWEQALSPFLLALQIAPKVALSLIHI